MKTLQFKCTLLSDVIINQKAATEGNQETLDFIPGNNFLGVAASFLYYDEKKIPDKNRLSLEESLLVFHSGKVRFGDAHPAYNNIRTLRIPASMFYPKLKKANEECYIHHKISNFTFLEAEQLKQCRTGFYAFKDKIGQEVDVPKTFAIKSAYDRENRRSKDEQMYGYQSIDKGAGFFFDVEIDGDISEELTKKIKQALVGDTKHVGRSRTAQYGLVKIEEAEFSYPETQNDENSVVTIYADGRLIFLDDNGLPTFQPVPEQLGLEKEDEILWEKSQIRTFQYAPWNFKRQARDTDRCGIEKGSVFAVRTKKTLPKSNYIGSYQNEGFGKIVYNPSFLQAEEDSNGKAKWKLFGKKENEKKEEVKEEKDLLTGDTLLDFLIQEKVKEETNNNIYKMVNEFVTNNRDKFKGDTFASQWGTIRNIAMKVHTKKDLEKELFDDSNKKENDKKAYLTHGVVQDKWNERGRINMLENFIRNLNESNAQLAVINLATAMAKECKNDTKGGKSNG